MAGEEAARPPEILVVDDSATSLQVLHEILTRQGYRVRPASSGELALRSVEVKLPDLAIIDVRMPGLDGFEVCRRLKAAERTRNLPVLFLSASQENIDKIRGFEAGGLDYITKPFESSEVLARVATHLRLRELGERLESKVRDRTAELVAANARLSQEISERRRAEAGLIESEERFRAVFEGSPIGKCITAPDGRLLRVNRAYADMFGYTAEEVQNRTFADITHPEDVAASGELVRALLDGEASSGRMEKRYVRKDGRVVWTELHTALLRDAAGAPLHFITGIIDISVRKRAQDALKESEARYQLVFEHSGTVNSLFDRECRLVLQNSLSAKHLGAPHGEAIGKPVSELFPPPRGAEVEARMRRVLSTGAPESFESEFDLPSGKRHFFSLYQPLPDSTGAIQWVQIISQEITERKNTENAIRANEARLKTLLETAMDGFWRVDALGRLLEVNRSYCAMSGYSRDELLAMSIHEVEALEDDREIHTHLERIAHHGQDRFESEHRRRDGTLFPVEISVQKDPTLPGAMVAFIRDISKHKRIEAALRESEFFFRESQRAAHIGSYKADFVGGFWESSEVLDQIFGIDAAYGRDIPGWLALVHPEDRDTMGRHLSEEVIGGKQPFNREYRILRPLDGQTRWVLGLGQPEFDGSGAVRGLIGTIQDITERHTIEAEHRELQAQLAQAQKMEAVGQLAGGVAHDFNNMLGVILARAEAGMGKLPPENPVRGYLEEIFDAGRRSADLTRQLLAFARRQTTAPRVLDLNEAVSGMLQMLQRLVGENVRLVWRPASGLSPLRLDPSQIDQVITNLCVNARDAIQDRGTVTLQTRNLRIEEAKASRPDALPPGDYVELRFEDDGCGMDEKTRERIFEPFFSTKGVGKGTGLGLSTVYGIVKQNLGSIEVESQPGRGTAFRLLFPGHRGDAVDPAPAAGGAPPRPRGSGQTILLVEDEPMLLSSIHEILEENGYRVLPAATVGEADSFARKYGAEVSLLITDLIMPEINGVELAHRLRARHPALGVLLMSGYSDDLLGDRGGIPAGMSFIQKPFTIEELSLTVRNILSP
ncbi:MAG: PAS domain S-box protein [Spirochaetes bacterium]|nr:PAS domain S-box protein [Spirochaetota bacterium]